MTFDRWIKIVSKTGFQNENNYSVWTIHFCRFSTVSKFCYGAQPHTRKRHGFLNMRRQYLVAKFTDKYHSWRHDKACTLYNTNGTKYALAYKRMHLWHALPKASTLNSDSNKHDYLMPQIILFDKAAFQLKNGKIPRKKRQRSPVFTYRRSS